MTESPVNAIARREVVYRLPGTETVVVRRGLEYRAEEAGPLTMDVYRPATAGNDAQLPIVVIVAGYRDAGFQRMLGCSFKDMGSTVGWARLMAASGIAAIAYVNREPVADLEEILRHLRENGESLGLDGERIGLWASSGNAPLALWALTAGREVHPRCAALLYPYTLDLDGHTGVAEAAAMFRFENPAAGKSAADLPADVPLFLARAGLDEMPRLNETLDRFLGAALSRNLPVTLANHSRGPHAFDLLDDGETSREIVRATLQFLRMHLLGAG
jgi:hypothetical protein